MLKVSKQVDYGLQLLVALRDSTPRAVVSLRKFSEEHTISFLFLQRIAGSLKRAGLIDAVLGKQGGYFLTQDLHQISLKDVIEAIDGPYTLALCQKEAGACGKEHACTVRPGLQQMRDRMVEAMEHMRVADFMGLNV